MFPQITIWSSVIYMTGIGIALATILWILWVYRNCTKYNLSFGKFFNWLGLFLIVPYLLGRYVCDLIKYRFIIPNDFFDLLSPYGYNFSFIGVSLWLIIVLGIFLKTIQYKEEKKKRIDILFLSFMRWLFILGFFLLLWDTFFGSATNSIFGITAIIQDSSLVSHGKVWPIGLFVSILALFLFVFIKVLLITTKKHWISIIGYVLLFLWFNIIFHFQHYSKHFIIWNIDIKIFYWYIMSIIIVSLYYIIIWAKKPQ